MKKRLFAFAVLALVFVSVLASAETITLDQAKEIALTKAGVAKEDAIFTKAYLDLDDGRLEYEIEFYANANEYEMDVDANTGDVRDYEVESKPRDFAAQQVTVEEAKQIALADAGFSAAEATFRKQDLDKDDGRRQYEIEFVVNGVEYEYEIDPTTGRILKAEIDRD